MTDNEITYLIRGAVFEVYNALGPGLLESVYEEALCFELQNRGLMVERQKHVPVVYKGHVLNTELRLDLLVEDGKLIAAVDACCGAMGVVHGPLDLEMIRDIDEGRKSANECFSHAGAVKIANIDNKVAFMKDDLLKAYENKEERAILATDTMIMTVAMEIAGLIAVSKNPIDGIVLTGSMGSMKEPVDFEAKLNKYLKNKYEIRIISSESGAIGAAQIARDIFNGKREIMGIKVDY